MLLSFMSEKLVLLEIEAKEKSAVIKELVNKIDSAGKLINRDNFLNAIIKREEIETTAIGKGIAIPHGRCEDVRDMSILFARSKEGIDFKSLDGKPVHILFMIAAPLDANKQYLQTIARIARFLRHEEIKDKIMNTDSALGILDIIKEFDNQCPIQGNIQTKDGRVIHGK